MSYSFGGLVQAAAAGATKQGLVETLKANGVEITEAVLADINRALSK